MYKKLLLINTDKILHDRLTGIALIAYSIMYLFIRLLINNPGSIIGPFIIGTLCLLIIPAYIKSMSVIDPEPETTDDDDDACCGGDRGTPTEDSDLPVAEGGVA